MRFTQTPSAPFVGALLVTALLSTTPAGAKSHHPARPAAKTSQSAPIQNTAADNHHSSSAGAGVAAAGAIGAAAFMLGGSHGGQSSGAVAPSAPAVQVTPTVKSTPGSLVTFSPTAVHPVATRVTPYVTVQPPALVFTTPLHRRVTTTSVVIPTPADLTTAAVQVHNVDRIINGPIHAVDRGINGTDYVTQGILPANVVDRGIISDGGNHTTTGATPEPAPGLILASGLFGLGALAFIRRRSQAV